jgi:hypothetical protein
MRARKCICTLALGAAALGVSVYAAPRDGAAARGKEQVRSDSLRLTTGSDAVLRESVGGVADRSTAYMRLVPVAPLAGGAAYPTGTMLDSANNTINSPGGPHLIWFDIRFGNWGGTGNGIIRTIQWTVGLGYDRLDQSIAPLDPGDINVPRPACTTDDDCHAIGFGPDGRATSSGGDSGCNRPNDAGVCRAWFIQANRPDYAGSGWNFAACNPAIGCGDTQVAGAPWPDNRGETYAGTVILELKTNVPGTYSIPLDPDIGATFFETTEPNTYAVTKLEDAIIEIASGRCCDPQGGCVEDVPLSKCAGGPAFWAEGTLCPQNGGPPCADCPNGLDSECNNFPTDVGGACTQNICNQQTLLCEFPPIPTWDGFGSGECCNPANGATEDRLPADPDPCEVYTCSVDDALSLGVRDTQAAADGATCDDGNPCSHTDVCVGGLCEGTNVVGEACAEDVDCQYDGDTPGAVCVDGFCDCQLAVNLSFGVLPGDKEDPNCFNADDKITVEIQMGPSAVEITGGQFYIAYDPTCLGFQSAVPGGAGECIEEGFCSGGSNNGAACLSNGECPGGDCICVRDDSNPYTLEVQETVDESTGRIFYAVSVAPGGAGTFGNTVLATLTFTKLGGCTSCSLQFLNENPLHTRLVDATGQNVEVEKKPSKEIRQAPSVSIDGPDTVKVNVACDSNTREVTWDKPTATSDCEDIELVCTGEHVESGCIAGACCGGANDGQPCTSKAQCPLGACFPGANMGGNFPVGNTNFCCNAVNSCGNAAEHCWTVTVNDQTTIDVEIQLSPTMKTKPGQGIVRCIKFEVFSNCVQAPLVFEEDIVFGGLFNLIGHFNNAIKIPSQVQPACITARDQLHTLRSCYLFQPGDCDANGVLHAEFKGDPFFGGNWLVGGNLDGWKKDNPNASHDVIDILDFGTLVAQWMVDYGSGDTPCGTSGPNADINGDGVVDLLDYSFVAMNFLEDSKDCCCPGSASLGNTNGRTSITVEELKRMDMKDLTMADLNNDGVVDLQDMELLMQGVRPERTAPNRDGKSSTGSRSLGR